MGILSVAEQDVFLAAYFGANKAAGAPASFQLALFNDDPTVGGVEMDSVGGYARVTVTNDGTNFPAPASGELVGAVQTFPTPTGAWTAAGVADTATYWVLYNAATGDAVIGEALTQEIDVEASGGTVTVQPIIFFGGYTLDEGAA